MLPFVITFQHPDGRTFVTVVLIEERGLNREALTAIALAIASRGMKGWELISHTVADHFMEMVAPPTDQN